ncbi:response regulator [candidate division KSB1 bacterium]|nr:response regulator [candidate division KSB1 bacterium]
MQNNNKITGWPDGNGKQDEIKILLAEDNSEMRKLLAWSLSNQGYTVIECPDGCCVLRKLGIGDETHQERFDLIVSDIRMPGITGLEVLEGKRIFNELPPIILITAFPDQETFAEAERLGAEAVFAKPFEIDDLLAKIRDLLPLFKKTVHKKGSSIQLQFPLEITYRRRKALPAVDDYIREMTTKLNQFSKDIHHCRIVIDELHPDDHKKHKYQVEIVLDVPGKSIVSTYDVDNGDGEGNLYYAIHVAFSRVYRELKKLMEKRRNFRKNKTDIAKTVKED